MNLDGFKPIFINNEKSNYMINAEGVCINIKTDKIKKCHTNGNGRHMLRLYHNGIPHTKQVARWILLTFNPIKNPELFQVDHIDEDPLNDKLYNLQWLSPEDNFKKAVNMNKIIYGENHPNSTLTDDLTKKLCKDLEKGKLTYKELMKKYNITKSHICGIKYGYYRNNISKDFIFKNKKHKQKSINYTAYLDSIHELMQLGYKNKEIAKSLGIEWSDRVSHKLNSIRKSIKKDESSTTIENTENEYYTIHINV